jgi:TatD DNase family protein
MANLYVDTHTHLYTDHFDSDREETVRRAIANGIERLLLPNIDLSSIEPMHELCKAFPSTCFPMMGLHPSSVGPNWENDLKHMEALLATGRYIAIGETGMDLYWDKTYLEEQRAAFKIQVNWAKTHQLPLVIHAREAFDELFSILDELNDETLTGVFHCFTGTLEQAEKIIAYGGFKLGIGGVLTYKKSGLDAVVQHIDLKHLILETDSPYLPPVPYRGKRNESAYLVHVAELLAEIKGVSLQELAVITSRNAEELFKLNTHVEQA